MTRSEFIRRLTAGLRGMASADAADVAADYEAHFDAGLAAGRSEEDIAAALGDPDRLAREIRLEAGIRGWQERRSPTSAFAAIVAFMGLATLDILILLPLIISAIAVILALYVAVVAVLVAGGAILIVGPFSQFPGGALAAIPAGLGVMAASIAAGALLTIVTIWVVNALMWFGRLHYRVIEPAIHSDVA